MEPEPRNAFFSSVQGDDFDGIRESAEEAGKPIDWRIRMAEKTPPSPGTSRDAIRSEIEKSEVVLLALGARSGTILEDRDVSIVEDEYGVAKELGRPVIVLLQQGVEFEPRQKEFVARLRGDWNDGHWAPRIFGGAADIGLDAVMPALLEFERRGRRGADIEPFAREALETILDAADTANAAVVGAIVREIETRRRRSDDVSFRTMFDLLAETPAFYGDLGTEVSRHTERIGTIMASAAPLLLGDEFARNHREGVIASQTILREFRDRASEVHFIAAVKDRPSPLEQQLRDALDAMHDGLFERQRQLAEIKLALLNSADPVR